MRVGTTPPVEVTVAAEASPNFFRATIGPAVRAVVTQLVSLGLGSRVFPLEEVLYSASDPNWSALTNYVTFEICYFSIVIVNVQEEG